MDLVLFRANFVDRIVLSLILDFYHQDRFLYLLGIVLCLEFSKPFPSLGVVDQVVSPSSSFVAYVPQGTQQAPQP